MSLLVVVVVVVGRSSNGGGLQRGNTTEHLTHSSLHLLCYDSIPATRDPPHPPSATYSIPSSAVAVRL
uniref:Putative secreted protein n=1 Tax=Anopheles triannulatus TaxID=58253 RepID=A0A2M4B8D2_9DIPT